MWRLRTGLSLLVAFGLPTAAQACPVCGNHGDTLATLLTYGAFMTTPFLLAGGMGFVIYRQVRQLRPHGAEAGGDETAAAPAGGRVPSPAGSG